MMKGTDAFNKVIEEYLDEYADKHPEFGKVYPNPQKPIKDCVTYILNKVKESNRQGFVDSEIYALARTFYEKDVDPGAEIQVDIRINHHVELSEKEKEEIRQKAIQDIINETRDKMTTKKPKPTKPKGNTEKTLELF